MSTEDPRSCTKQWLDGYLDNWNILEDDEFTRAKFIVAYANADYPWIRVFYDRYIDLVFCVDTPESEALPVGVGYIENMPITIFTIDKPGITGTKLRWKAEAELRRVAETEPLGSLRTLNRLSDNEKNLGSTILYSATYILRYKRYV